MDDYPVLEPQMNLSLHETAPVRVACAAEEAFGHWLAQAGGSILLSTYQSGKVAMIGWDGRQVTLTMREFDKPLGLAVRGSRIALAARHDLWMLANARPLARDYLEDQPGRYDALYLPRATYHTGNLHTHDVVFDGDDLLLVNTRFSCLARLSPDFSFRPVWKPAFVTDLVPEDRCHLNGLTLREGRPGYVTAMGMTDEAGQWRERKATGGVVLDVQSNDVVASGLCMPHSPRWHQGRLWVLNSGRGELLTVDPKTGQKDVVLGLPGYVRGLCFAGPYALVGLSKIREKHIFGGLPIQERNTALRCGVAVVELGRGTLVGMFEFTEGCEELYDVQFLPGVQRPTILNLDKPETREAITNPESCYWLRPSAEIPETAAAGQAAGDGQVSSVRGGDTTRSLSSSMGNTLPESGTQV